jgi:hypothetical protein
MDTDSSNKSEMTVFSASTKYTNLEMFDARAPAVYISIFEPPPPELILEDERVNPFCRDFSPPAKENKPRLPYTGELVWRMGNGPLEQYRKFDK